MQWCAVCDNFGKVRGILPVFYCVFSQIRIRFDDFFSVLGLCGPPQDSRLSRISHKDRWKRATRGGVWLPIRVHKLVEVRGPCTAYGNQSGRRDSNAHLKAWKACTLTVVLHPHNDD